MPEWLKKLILEKLGHKSCQTLKLHSPQLREIASRKILTPADQIKLNAIANDIDAGGI